MTAAVLAAVGLAAGACLLVAGLAPRPEPLDRALARLARPVPRQAAQPKVARGGNGAEASDDSDLDSRVGGWLRRVPLVDRVTGRLGSDLRILGRSPDQQIAQLAAFGLVGLLWAPVVSAGCLLIGVGVPLVVPAWLAPAGAVVMVVVPCRRARHDAAEARAAFAHALSAFCDVATIALSAGQETHGALFQAAGAGTGPAFAEIDNALQAGFLAGQRPADALQQLGRDLGIDDLVDLGGTIALAENEGAPVNDSIAAKARSIRERLIGDTERAAASATERMAIPGAMLMLGFLWFTSFPALYLIFEQAH